MQSSESVRVAVSLALLVLSGVVVTDYARMLLWYWPLWRAAPRATVPLLTGLIGLTLGVMWDAMLWLWLIVPGVLSPESDAIDAAYVVTIAGFTAPRLVWWWSARYIRNALDHERASISGRASWLVTVCGLSLVAVALAAGYATSGFSPLGEFPVPQTVHTRVPGVDGPAAYAGTSVEVSGTKCVASKNAVFVSGTSQWVRLDVGGAAPIAHYAAGRSREPGCKTQTFVNELPDEVVPGTWRLEGSETVRDGPRSQTRAWYTESFKVLPAP